jgi:hypothetical protein
MQSLMTKHSGFLSGLYTIVSGSTVYTVKIGRKTNGIRRYFTEVAVLNMMKEKNKKFETTVRIKGFTCNKRMWLETLIE